MDEWLYRKIYREMRSVEDAEILSERFSLQKEILLGILSQKIVRRTKKRYYLVKKKSEKMLFDWKNEKSFLEISSEIGFSPVLTANFILRQCGYSKKEIREMMKNPESIGDERLRREIVEVLEEDIVYSPIGLKIQRKNGEKAEEEIKVWLESNGIEFLRENDVKKIYQKTPDFLLKKRIFIKGKKIYWIESKASFGDKVQMRMDYKRQLRHYLEIFGSGLVVYWNGYLNDNGSLQPFYYNNRIHVTNSEFFGEKNAL